MTIEEITLIPPGKLRCVITEKLRPDTPEEHVRQRIARSLMEDYSYAKGDIEIEFTINVASSKKREKPCAKSAGRQRSNNFNCLTSFPLP